MMGSDDAEQAHDARSNGHGQRTAQHDATTTHNDHQHQQFIPSGTSDEGPTKKRNARKSDDTIATASSSSPLPAVPGKRRVRKTRKSVDGDSDESNSSKRAVIIKYAALLLLVAQMVGLVLLMRYSRTVARGPTEPLYLASTAVFVMEIMKLILCLAVVLYDSGGLSEFARELHHHTIGSPLEIAKLCVPSLLYTVQNNLLYLALTNLDAATYQVCYQLKILTTAVFSAVLLQRKFSPQKWAALVVLTVGVAVVQISGSADQHSAASATTIAATHGDAHESEQHVQRVALELAAASRNRWIGLVAVVCAAGTSGFSGVYFGECVCVCVSACLYLRITNYIQFVVGLVLIQFSQSRCLCQHRKNPQRQSYFPLDSQRPNGIAVGPDCLHDCVHQGRGGRATTRLLGRLHGHCLDRRHSAGRGWSHCCHGRQVRRQCAQSICDFL